MYAEYPRIYLIPNCTDSHLWGHDRSEGRPNVTENDMVHERKNFRHSAPEVSKSTRKTVHLLVPTCLLVPSELTNATFVFGSLLNKHDLSTGPFWTNPLSSGLFWTNTTYVYWSLLNKPYLYLRVPSEPTPLMSTSLFWTNSVYWSLLNIAYRCLLVSSEETLRLLVPYEQSLPVSTGPFWTKPTCVYRSLLNKAYLCLPVPSEQCLPVATGLIWTNSAWGYWSLANKPYLCLLVPCEQTLPVSIGPSWTNPTVSIGSFWTNSMSTEKKPYLCLLLTSVP